MRALSLMIVAVAAVAAPAQAQELSRGTQRLELVGAAQVGCVAGAARPGRQVNATFQDGGPAGGTVVIPVMVDPNTAATLGSSIELSLPVVCNTSHSISVRSYNGALTRDGANGRAAGGFAESQVYGVAVTWQNQTARIDGTNRTAAFAWPQPAKGDVTVDIEVPRGTAPLVAGAYRDAVVVEIRPAN